MNIRSIGIDIGKTIATNMVSVNLQQESRPKAALYERVETVHTKTAGCGSGVVGIRSGLCNAIYETRH